MRRKPPPFTRGYLTNEVVTEYAIKQFLANPDRQTSHLHLGPPDIFVDAVGFGSGKKDGRFLAGHVWLYQLGETAALRQCDKPFSEQFLLLFERIIG